MKKRILISEIQLSHKLHAVAAEVRFHHSSYQTLGLADISKERFVSISLEYKTNKVI
jgi:hypothetical protein